MSESGLSDIIGMDVVPALIKGRKAEGSPVKLWHLAEIQGRRIDKIIDNISRMQLSIQRVKRRRLDMAGRDYQQKADETKADLKSVRERAVAFVKAVTTL